MKKGSTDSLRSELQEWLEAAPAVEEANAQLEGQYKDFETDPAFVADYLKMQFVEDVLAAMEDQGLSKSQLAQKLGKSRQYVGRVLNERANLTFERIAEFACALGMRVSVGMSERKASPENVPHPASSSAPSASPPPGAAVERNASTRTSGKKQRTPKGGAAAKPRR